MRRWWWLAGLIVAVLILAACGRSRPAPAAETPTTEVVTTEATEAAEAPATATPAEQVAVPEGPVELPPVNPLKVSGDIVTAGSSTVFPLTEALAERFINEGYKDQITVDSIGSGAGFQRFCQAGETDISNASRPIKDSEVADCRAIGRNPIEFRVGTDALAVTVSPENDWLTDGVTMEELARIFSSDSTNWSDVNPEWPDRLIQRFVPGTDSGTYDFFIEAVMAPVYGDEAEIKFLGAQNLQLSEDDNVLVQGVSGSKNGVGFFGYAYYLENEDSLAVLDLDGITADDETVEDGTYPLARPLFIYSDAGIMKSKPQAAAFIDFYLTHVNEEVQRVGYFPASEDAIKVAKAAWLQALGE